MRHNKRSRLERGIGFGNKSGEIGLIVAQKGSLKPLPIRSGAAAIPQAGFHSM
jgi:hypothetical protein